MLNYTVSTLGTLKGMPPYRGYSVRGHCRACPVLTHAVKVDGGTPCKTAHPYILLYKMNVKRQGNLYWNKLLGQFQTLLFRQLVGKLVVGVPRVPAHPAPTGPQPPVFSN